MSDNVLMLLKLSQATKTPEVKEKDKASDETNPEIDTREDDLIPITLEEHPGVSVSSEKEEQKDNSWPVKRRGVGKIRKGLRNKFAKGRGGRIVPKKEEILVSLRRN